MKQRLGRNRILLDRNDLRARAPKNDELSLRWPLARQAESVRRWFRRLNSSYRRGSSVRRRADGGGCLMFILLEAEQSAAHQERIILATVFRGHYVSLVKVLSQTARPALLVRVSA